MTETKTPIGQRIIWARKRKGISQERLAEIIGTSRRHMLRIETGRVKRPGDNFLALIAEATEQPVEFFADDERAADDDEDDSEMRETYELFVALMERIGKRQVAA